MGRLLVQTEKEKWRIAHDSAERYVRDHFLSEAQGLQERVPQLPQSSDHAREALNARLKLVCERNASLREAKALERQRGEFPPDAAIVSTLWNGWREDALVCSRIGPPSAESFSPTPENEHGTERLNFVLLVFYLMVGTAGLLYIFTRFHTTSSVRETRNSVSWTLIFVVLLYVPVPALVAPVKLNLLQYLVGTPFTNLPQQVVPWRKVDLPVLTLRDINGDGIVQWAEVMMQPDMIVLAMPGIVGLPYMLSGLITAGALATALPTADGLLLAIADALLHNVYSHMIDNTVSHQWRMTSAEVVLLGMALLAVYVTSLKPDNILFLVGMALLLATSCFFPVLVLGVFWKRANRAGAITGMLMGLVMSVCCIIANHPFFMYMMGLFGQPWFGVDLTASGTLGTPAGLVAAIVVSLLTKPNRPMVDKFVGYIRDSL